jgi:hypothetical protein
MCVEDRAPERWAVYSDADRGSSVYRGDSVTGGRRVGLEEVSTELRAAERS